MSSMTNTSLDHRSDEYLMNRLFELYDHADDHADEIAALDAAIQARLAATYLPEPIVVPRRRLAA